MLKDCREAVCGREEWVRARRSTKGYPIESISSGMVGFVSLHLLLNFPCLISPFIEFFLNR